MRITVIGAGYVGLVTGAGLADKGHSVVCVDKDASRIDSLAAGNVPFFEPGLEDLVVRCSERGLLRFAVGLSGDISSHDAVVLAVGTPQREDGSSDLTALDRATAELAPRLVPGQAVIVKSTVPVGTGDRLVAILPAGVHVISNPEFLREGSAVADFLTPDRIVAGVQDTCAEAIMRTLYRDFPAPLVIVGRRESEFAKYAANAFLAMKVTFANEMADLAAGLGASWEPVRRVLGADPRIGSGFLSPGPGYGGSCFPKDVLSLISQSADVASPSCLLEATHRSNDRRVSAIGEMLGADGDRAGLTVILGGAFKAGTGDIRESRGIAVAKYLLLRARNVRFHDPMATPAIRREGFEATDDFISAVAGAHRIAVMTEWQEYADIDWRAVREVVASPVVMDFRGVVDTARARDAGFIVHAVGEPALGG